MDTEIVVAGIGLTMYEAISGTFYTSTSGNDFGEPA